MRGAVAGDETQEEEELLQGQTSREVGESSSISAMNKRRPPRGKAASLLARLAQSQPSLPTAAEEDDDESASAFQNWKVPVLKRKSYFETLDNVTHPFPDGELPFLKLRCGTPCESVRSITSPLASTKPPTAAVDSLQATSSSWFGGSFQHDPEFLGMSPSVQVRRGALTKAFLEARLPLNLFLGQADRDILSRGRRKEPDDFEDEVEVVLRSVPEHVGAVFGLLSKDGILDVQHELGNALLLLDHPYPDFSWLQQAIADHCSSRDVVDLEDFSMTIAAFENSRHEFLSNLFEINCVTEGKVPVAEIPRMIEEAGVPLVPGAAAELMSGICKKFIDFDAFVTVYEDATERAGLTIAEYNRALSELKTGTLIGNGWKVTEQHLRSSLAWSDGLTRFAGGDAAVDIIVSQAVHQSRQGRVVLDLKAWQARPPPSLSEDECGDESYSEGDPIITGRAFLMAFAVMHHRLAEALRRTPALANLDTSVDLINHEELMSILEHMEEWACTTARVNESLIACGFRAAEDAYTFGQTYTFLLNYCLSEGVTKSEASFLGRVFRRFDHDRNGCLDIKELGVAIRWMGYQPSLYRIYNFAEELGLERNSHFSFIKFTRLMGRFVKASLAPVRQAFKSEGPSSGEELPTVQLKSLLCMVGYRPSAEEVRMLVEEAGGTDGMLDFRRFKELEQLHRDGVRNFLEENGGCTSLELAQYEKCFQEHSLESNDGQVYFDPKAMRAVLQDMFPDTGLCKQRYERLSDVLNKSDSDNDGKLEIHEFVRVMAALTSDDDQDLLCRGIDLKDELGYSSSDLRDLRELFNVADITLSGDITLDELVQILSKMVSITVTSKREIQTMLGKFDDGDGRLDFWEFISFVRHLQETNWRNINGLARAE